MLRDVRGLGRHGCRLPSLAALCTVGAFMGAPEGLSSAIRTDLAADLSRRDFLTRAGGLGLGALVLGAIPVAEQMTRPSRAVAAAPIANDARLQAFWDTMVPGRKASKTQSGRDIDPKAILGVDPEPGAVEADALLLGQDTRIGFDVLAPPFLAELEARSAVQGGDFLDLDWNAREAVCIQGTAYANATRLVWEAAAAVAFTAFCAAATVPNATAKTAVGYEVMGHPGAAPRGYRGFSYGRKLARERTKHGYLP